MFLFDEKTYCPCGYQDTYASCCLSFHKNLDFPKTAEALMRSRYSAYVFKNANYLLATWYKATRPATLDFWGENIVWQKLDILKTKKGNVSDEKGRVHFNAYYLQNGENRVLSENSRFKKVNGRWFYVDGDVTVL